MKLNLMAPINQLGYGIAGLNFYKSLSKLTDVALHVIGQPQITNQEDADLILKGIEKARFFDPKAPCVKMWHQNDMAQFVGRGEHIGFPIFELDTFNELELHHLKSCDRIFVCSKWAQDVVYEQLGVTGSACDLNWGVDVIPLGVDASIFKQAEPRQEDKTIFFNCGKWEIRKGHDILIEAFKQVCEKHNDVELWMMCSNPFNSPDEEAKWQQLYNHHKVKIIPRAETQQDVYNIMSNVDCGVFPSRGEGWNLELLEMMSIGKHVIATDYSAHTEFCTKDNCGLVPITNKEPAFDGKWFFGQGKWAKIGETEIELLVHKMSEFITDHKGLKNEAGIDTANQFSWDNAARKFLEKI